MLRKDKTSKDPILIVDDEPKIIFAFLRTLQDEPYDIRFAFDGGKALRILERDPVKVIICDERMPRQSGIELLSIAKKKHPDVVRIMLTGAVDLETAVKAVNLAEVYRYIVKPWDNLELISALSSAVRKHDLDAGKQRFPKAGLTRRYDLKRITRKIAGTTEIAGVGIPEFSEREIARLLARLESGR